MALISLLIKADSRGKIIYKQERLGLSGKPFRIYKFRTMSSTIPHLDEENDNWATRDDSRVTPFGAYLRKYHWDEIPQFFNVLKGDMALVGPRPYRHSVHLNIEQVEPSWSQRLKFKPGMTGLAQLYSYKGDVLAEHAFKLEYDLQTGELSLPGYLRILIITPFYAAWKGSH